jgi:Holliday junction resolvasome RuvABC DNA-binding subunit
LCDGHHRLLHDGLLTITGRAPDDVVIKRNGIRLLTGMPELDPRMMNVPPLESRRTAHAVRKHASDEDKARPRRAPAPSPEMSMVESGDTVTLARAALRQLGFKADTAAQAVKAAQAGVGADVTLDVLIKEALRCTNHCQRTL